MQRLAGPIPYQSAIHSRLWDPTSPHGRQRRAQGLPGSHPSRKLFSCEGPLPGHEGGLSRKASEGRAG